MPNTSNTGKKQKNKPGNPNINEVNQKTRFKKGFDARRNLKGRPKSFDALRELALIIANEDIKTSEGLRSNTENLLRQWKDGDFPSQKHFSEIAFGKVPDEIKHTGDNKIELVIRYAKPDHKPTKPAP